MDNDNCKIFQNKEKKPKDKVVKNKDSIRTEKIDPRDYDYVKPENYEEMYYDEPCIQWTINRDYDTEANTKDGYCINMPTSEEEYMNNKHLFSNKQTLYVFYDSKDRIKSYMVKMNLSDDSDDYFNECILNQDEMKVVDILSRHNNIDKKSINWENPRELHKIGYCDFKLPPKKLATQFFKCKNCETVPMYDRIEKVIYSAKFGDFRGLVEHENIPVQKKEIIQKPRETRGRKKKQIVQPEVEDVKVKKEKRTVKSKKKKSKKSKKSDDKKKIKSKEVRPKKGRPRGRRKVEISSEEEQSDFLNETIESSHTTEELEESETKEKNKQALKKLSEEKNTNSETVEGSKTDITVPTSEHSFTIEASTTGLDTEEAQEDFTLKQETCENEISMTDIQEIPSDSPVKKRKKEISEKKFKCEKCGSTFTSSYGKKYHVDKVHTKEKDQVIKPFHCPIEDCLKRYKNNNGLKYHLKRQHNISTSTYDDMNIDDL